MPATATPVTHRPAARFTPARGPQGNSPGRGAQPSRGIQPARGIQPRGAQPTGGIRPSRAESTGGIQPARGIPPARGAQPARGPQPAPGAQPWRGNTSAPGNASPRGDPPVAGGRPPLRGNRSAGPRPPQAEHEILFQKFFKSVGPRTYAAQVKRARNGNHYLILTEGKREEASDEVRKTRLFVFSEDFVEFFRLVKSAAEFIKANPLPDDVRRMRVKFWEKHAGSGGGGAPARPFAKPASGAAPAVDRATSASRRVGTP